MGKAGGKENPVDKAAAKKRKRKAKELLAAIMEYASKDQSSSSGEESDDAPTSSKAVKSKKAKKSREETADSTSDAEKGLHDSPPRRGKSLATKGVRTPRNAARRDASSAQTDQSLRQTKKTTVKPSPRGATTKTTLGAGRKPPQPTKTSKPDQAVSSARRRKPSVELEEDDGDSEDEGDESSDSANDDENQDEAPGEEADSALNSSGENALLSTQLSTSATGSKKRVPPKTAPKKGRLQRGAGKLSVSGTKPPAATSRKRALLTETAADVTAETATPPALKRLRSAAVKAPGQKGSAAQSVAHDALVVSTDMQSPREQPVTKRRVVAERIGDSRRGPTPSTSRASSPSARQQEVKPRAKPKQRATKATLNKVGQLDSSGQPALGTRAEVLAYLTSLDVPSEMYTLPATKAEQEAAGMLPPRHLTYRPVVGESSAAEKWHLLQPDDSVSDAFDRYDGKINLSRLSAENRFEYVCVLLLLSDLCDAGISRLRTCMLLNARDLRDPFYLILRDFNTQFVSQQRITVENNLNGMWWYLKVLFAQRWYVAIPMRKKGHLWKLLAFSGDNWGRQYHWFEMFFVAPAETVEHVRAIFDDPANANLRGQEFSSSIALLLAQDGDLVKRWWAIRERAVDACSFNSRRCIEMDVVPEYRSATDTRGTWPERLDPSARTVVSTCAEMRRDKGNITFNTAYIDTDPLVFTYWMYTLAECVMTRVNTNKTDPNYLRLLASDVRRTRRACGKLLASTGDDKGEDDALDVVVDYLGDDAAVLAAVAEFRDRTVVLSELQPPFASGDGWTVTAHLHRAEDEARNDLTIVLPVSNVSNYIPTDVANSAAPSSSYPIVSAPAASQQPVNDQKTDDAEVVILDSSTPSNSNAVLTPVNTEQAAVNAEEAAKVRPQSSLELLATAYQASSVSTLTSLSNSPELLHATPDEPDLPSTVPTTIADWKLRHLRHTVGVYSWEQLALGPLQLELRKLLSAGSPPAQWNEELLFVFALEFLTAYSLRYQSDAVALLQPGFWTTPYVQGATCPESQLQSVDDEPFFIGSRRAVLSYGVYDEIPYLALVFAPRSMLAFDACLPQIATIAIFCPDDCSLEVFERLTLGVLLRLSFTLAGEAENVPPFGQWSCPAVIRFDVQPPTATPSPNDYILALLSQSCELLAFSTKKIPTFIRAMQFAQAPTFEAISKLLLRLFTCEEKNAPATQMTQLLIDWWNDVDDRASLDHNTALAIDLDSIHRAFSLFLRASALWDAGVTRWTEVLTTSAVSQQFRSESDDAFRSYQRSLSTSSTFARCEHFRHLLRLGFYVVGYGMQVVLLQNGSGHHLIVDATTRHISHYGKPVNDDDLSGLATVCLPYGLWSNEKDTWAIRFPS